MVRVLLHPERGFSCALLLRVERQPPLVLRRQLLLWWLGLLQVSLPCLVCPADGRVRRSPPARVDVIVARLAVGPRMRE